MFRERLSHLRYLCALPWRFGHDPELAVVPEWLNGQKLLLIDDELAEVILATEPEWRLSSCDLRAAYRSNDLWYSVTAEEEITHAEACNNTVVISELPRFHVTANAPRENLKGLTPFSCLALRKV
jgi:hypothetical protein